MNMEYRIYVNKKLVNICSNEFVLGCNLSSYFTKYGKENVETKHVVAIDDEENKEWLRHMWRD